MRRTVPMLALFALSALMAFGCGGDVASQALATPELQSKVMDMIGGNADMAGQMVDKLLAGDTKQVVMDKVTANADLMQGLVDKVAKDPAMVENVLKVAVQDEAVRTRVIDVLKGLGIKIR